MNKSVTLRRIKDNWQGCAKILDMSDKEFCMAVFPDAYDKKRSRDGLQRKRGKGDISMLELAPSTLRGLMAGNTKSYGQGKEAYVAAEFTGHLRSHLSTDASFRLIDGGFVGYKNSMLEKIGNLVSITVPQMTSEHGIFTKIKISDMWEGECRDGEALEKAINELRGFNSREAVVYALFLYILCGVFGKRISELSFLYSEEAIGQVYESSDMIDRIYTKNHIPLGEIDENSDYGDKYNLYLFRRTKNWLFDGATLSIERGIDNKYVATMTLADRNTGTGEALPDVRPIYRVFRGSPILSLQDELIYIIFKEDQTERFAIMSFRYQRFTTGKMYYRTGVLILADPELTKRNYSMVQKVCICKKRLDEMELEAVKGMLSTSDSQIVMTEEQLEEFTNKVKEDGYPWAEEFEKSYKEFIKMHSKRVYIFDENEIVASTFGDFTEEERMQIMLMLKSKSAPVKGNSYNFVSTGEHINFHRLVKEK